jgi:hypothetical protein
MTDRPAPDGRERGSELRLARLHLRGGTYALARVELETLAGADRLDRDAVLDLAEVRWRTGDLPGAAAAAETWLAEGEAGSGAPLILAHVICAEAAADGGRADEAAAHVQAAADGLGDRRTLEAVLAGIVARAAWGWGETPPSGLAADPGPVAAITPGQAPAVPAAAAAATAAAATPAPTPGAAEAPRKPAAAAAELARTGASLVIAAPERAAVLLALAVRADAGAADAVLAALDGTEVDPAQAASFAFVRAEALRAAGRHEEARIAYASAERLALAPAEAGPPGSSQ